MKESTKKEKDQENEARIARKAIGPSIKISYWIYYDRIFIINIFLKSKNTICLMRKLVQSWLCFGSINILPTLNKRKRASLKIQLKTSNLPNMSLNTIIKVRLSYGWPLMLTVKMILQQPSSN